MSRLLKNVRSWGRRVFRACCCCGGTENPYYETIGEISQHAREIARLRVLVEEKITMLAELKEEVQELRLVVYRLPFPPILYGNESWVEAAGTTNTIGAMASGAA